MNSIDVTAGNDMQKMVLSWLDAGELHFDGAAVGLPDLTSVLDDVIGIHKFTVAETVVVQESDQLVISGLVPLLGIERAWPWPGKNSHNPRSPFVFFPG